MINRTISHYRILEKLGSGGMGEVYLVLDTKLDRRVALKILPAAMASDEERMRRFTREAKAASALNHPHVAQIYEIDEAEGVHFIVMEYVSGQTLFEKISNHPMEIQQVIDIAIQLADALEKAHSQGIIHRDIKPNNIMITADGQAKILDFGLAKIVQPEKADSEISTAMHTEMGAVLGTVPYMSPEQALGQTIDQRADLFSLGIVLYEMITGRRPFSGASSAQTIDQIIHSQPQAISRLNYNVSPELERIVRKSLEKEPDRRYQSARELLADLKNLKRDTQTRVASAPGSRRYFPYVILILILAVTAYVAGRYIRPKAAPPNVPLRLAVLPFHILTAEHNIDYLGIAIPDTIITRLSNIHQIRLCPTDSILRFQNRQVDLNEVQKTLKADHVVNGTIQRVADRFRITVQLVRVRDGVSLWGKRYDLSNEDLLKLEDEVAEKVSDSLKIKLTAEDRQRVYQRYTQNTAAYDFYLRGRSALRRYNSEGTRAAVEAFQHSLQLDPNYALARAGLALASAEMHLRYAPAEEVKEWGEKAKDEAEKALQLDPNLAEAHEALSGVYRKTEFNWNRTIEESQKALDLNPSLELPHFYLAAAFYHLGLLERAEREVEKGLEIGGQNETEGLRTQGVIALIEARYNEAVSKLEQAQQVSGKPLADAYLPHAYYGAKQTAKAFALLDTLSHSSSASAVTRAKAAKAVFMAANGNSQEASALIELVTAGKYMDHHVAYDLGTACGILGRKDAALKWLSIAVDTGLPCYPLFEKDPLLDPLRNDPDFKKLLNELRTRCVAAKSQYGES